MRRGNKILIVGAGVAGPAAAIFLKRKGFEVELIEHAEKLGHIGFGLTIWPNGHRILEEIGIDAEIRELGNPVPWIQPMAPSGERLCKPLSFKEFKKFGEALVIVERSDLHSLIIGKMKKEGVKPRLGVSLANITNDGNKAHVEFSDGSSGVYDLVVACDGINSEMRERLFGKNQIDFYDWSIRGVWAPKSSSSPRGVAILTKEKIGLAIYPLRKKSFVVIYKYNPKRLPGSDLALDFEEFRPYLEKHGWNLDDIRALEKDALQNHQFYDHLRRVKMGPWSKGRVVLLGDSRHAFSPLIGMGANLALEDAWVLADELAGSANLADGLRNFGKRRTTRVNKIRNISAFVERWYMFTSRRARVWRDLLLKVTPHAIFYKLMGSVLERRP